MKTRIASLMILGLALWRHPAEAQVLYDDGPINGTNNAWTINFGYIVGDTFTLSANATVGGFNFGVWEYPGDLLTSVQWSVTQYFNSGTVYGSGVASGRNLSDQFISTNQYGFNIDQVTVTGLSVPLPAGPTYWLNLQNATVPSGDPVFWDENDGKGGGCPSQADWTSCIVSGPLCPPEAFDIVGTNGGGQTPEPSSILLFGSGILGAFRLLWRKRL
jgi:hypothetical protein